MKTLRWVYVFTGVECLSQVAYLVNRFPTLLRSGMFMKYFSNHGLNAAKRLPMLYAFPACYVRLCSICSHDRERSTYISLLQVHPLSSDFSYIVCSLWKSKMVMKNHCTGGILLLLSALLFQGAHTQGTYLC